MSHIVGITSFGIACGSEVPGIYTRVAEFLDWIEPKVWPESVNSRFDPDYDDTLGGNQEEEVSDESIIEADNEFLTAFNEGLHSMRAK